MLNHKSFARFVSAPENRAALQAVEELAAGLKAGRVDAVPNPVFLHGPTGTGKSHLVSALVREISGRQSALTVALVDSGSIGQIGIDSTDETWAAARQSDLFILEDVGFLPAWGWETLVQIIDYRLVRGQPTVITAACGPQHLHHRGANIPNRLASRLAAGLVVGMRPLQSGERLLLLQVAAQRRQLALNQEVLRWLAEHLTGGGRQLEGAINQLAQLARGNRHPLDLATVARHLGEQVEGNRTTVERIALRVSGYFRIEARQLQSRRRYRNILLPRQVCMYLASKLTRLSLDQIGAYFGGRDHSTVLHACRKVERAMDGDAVLSGAVRQLHADLA